MSSPSPGDPPLGTSSTSSTSGWLGGMELQGAPWMDKFDGVLHPRTPRISWYRWRMGSLLSRQGGGDLLRSILASSRVHRPRHSRDRVAHRPGLVPQGMREVDLLWLQVHLCRAEDCTQPGEFHCKEFAVLDADSVIDLGAYGRLDSWRVLVLVWRALRSLRQFFQVAYAAAHAEDLLRPRVTSKTKG